MAITHFYRLLAASLLLVLAACASGPAHVPQPMQPQSIDLTAYAPKVESFVVVLDISSSMAEDYQDRPKVHTAQDLVASFNATVPAAAFKSGLVTFGNGEGRCFGDGVATDAYGLTEHDASGFAAALGSIDCAGGTTPLSEGIDSASQMLSGQSGPLAVIVVSDFQWVSADAVKRSVASMKEQYPGEICLHTVKVGDNTTGDALIESITDAPGCDSALSAGDLTSSAAMATYVTDVLMGPLQYEDHSVSATALFDFDKAVLKEQGKAELDNLSEYIKGKGITVVDIDVIGHTDSMGSEEYNLDLSKRRAVAVSDYMAGKGVSASIMDVSGKGELEPVASNDTDEGRAKNRRVEILVGTTRVRQ